MARMLGVCLLGLILATAWAMAGPADVVSVSVTANATGQFRFTVTVRHADAGWDHYADRWEVLTMDGKLLGTRTLYHPHLNEQPFTRELAGVSIPEDVKEVVIRAHDSVHGFAGATQKVTLPGR
jgi:hypothetical protein